MILNKPQCIRFKATPSSSQSFSFLTKQISETKNWLIQIDTNHHQVCKALGPPEGCRKGI